MSDIPEPAKQMRKLMMVAIIVSAIAALAYAGSEMMAPDDEPTEMTDE